MNIFFLHMIPILCAQMHCDKHCVKMILELSQMLCTAHRVLDGKLKIGISKNGRKLKRYQLKGKNKNEILYKAAHINHPCTIWVRESSFNYAWTYELFCCLCDEYTKRYERTHLTDEKLRYWLRRHPKNIKHRPFTQFPQAMPDEYKNSDVVQAYRDYYKSKSDKFSMVWGKGEIDPPEWFKTRQ